MELVYLQSAALDAGDAAMKKTDIAPCFHGIFLFSYRYAFFCSLIITLSQLPQEETDYI